MRSILYPKPMNFKLYRDAFKFIVGLSVIGVFGLIYTVCVFMSHKVITREASVLQAPALSPWSLKVLGILFTSVIQFSGTRNWGRRNRQNKAESICHPQGQSVGYIASGKEGWTPIEWQ